MDTSSITTMLRRHATEERATAAMPTAREQAVGDPEFSFLKRRYRDGFQRAFCVRYC